MLASGDWMTPVLNGRDRFAKPILFYWLTGLSFKLFGIGLVPARLVSAFLGSLGLWVVFRMGGLLFNACTGLYAIFILASTYLYFLSSRLAYTDMTLCFFITLALFFLARFIEREARGGAAAKYDVFLFYTAVGLATATKGPPGFLLPGIIAVAYCLISGDRKDARSFVHPAGILTCLVLSLFWPVAMALMHGTAFIHHLVYAEGIDRVRHAEMLSPYFPLVILRYFAPWSLFLLCAGFTDFGEDRALLKNREKRRLFLWIAVGVPLALFTLLRIRHSRYMLPAFPALALVVGHYFHRVFAGEAPGQGRAFRMAFSFTTGLYAFVSLLSLAVLILISRFMTVPGIFFLVPLLFLLSVAGLSHSRRKRDFSLAPLLIAFPLLITFPLVAGKVLPLLNPDPMMGFSRAISQGWKPGTHVGTYRLGNGNQRLRILTGRPVEFMKKEKALTAFLKRGTPLFCALRGQDFQQLPEGLANGWRVAATGKKWRKIPMKDLWRATKDLTPRSLESLRERVVLIHKGGEGG